MKKKEFNLEEQEEENQRLIKRMEKEEFNLSKRCVWMKKKDDQWKSYVHTMHVKEFIKRLKEILDNFESNLHEKCVFEGIENAEPFLRLIRNQFEREIDKLAGKELI